RLAEAARHHLREKFLAAQAGLTGVNFAIASTGGVVVCTNEGNADLGTALPPIHIACMGVEKLVPSPRELAVFLRVLARSATGQPITAYTSHFHGPRPGGEMHIVIVDHGRARILARPEFRASLKCIRCGACMNTCPVYRRSRGTSAWSRALLRSSSRGRGLIEFLESWSGCLLRDYRIRGRASATCRRCRARVSARSGGTVSARDEILNKLRAAKPPAAEMP